MHERYHMSFEATGVYVAGSNRLLKVEFEGTAGVAPVGDSEPGRPILPGEGRVEIGGAAPLGKVTYPDP
ncbi:MAG: hypothetical protein HYX94_07550 [Chloroflexi bacterium]|nr:hypothetical protein [Chloroflexota bacterium]